MRMVTACKPISAGRLLLVAVLSIAFAGVEAAPRIKCWKNKEGIRECGYQVPAEYAQDEIEILNERGVTIEVQPRTPTAEERRRQEELERLRRAQAERDEILLRSFTTERDLLIARDNQLAALQGQIDVTRSNIRSEELRLEKLVRRAADYERGGKPVPDKLLKQIKASRTQIKAYQDFIAEREKNMAALTEKFKRDLARYRELTGGRPREPEATPTATR